MKEHKKLLTVTNLVYILLFLWYSIIFFDIPLLTTDGRASLISIYGLLELVLSIILVGLLLHWKYIYYFELLILILWGYLQFNGNWKYLFIETSEERIQSYYQFFDNTLRLFPKSDTMIIPDAYHIILGVLLLTNIVLVIRKIIMKFI